MDTTVSEYGFWIQSSSTSDPRLSDYRDKLQISEDNRRNEKGFLGLPLELRELIIELAIEHRKGIPYTPSATETPGTFETISLARHAIWKTTMGESTLLIE